MTEKTWDLVDSFFEEYDLVDHHIKSYNDFINKRIQEIIEFTDEISLENGKYKVRTGQVTIEKPFTKEADGSKSMIYQNLNLNLKKYILVNYLLCLNLTSVI